MVLYTLLALILYDYYEKNNDFLSDVDDITSGKTIASNVSKIYSWRTTSEAIDITLNESTKVFVMEYVYYATDDIVDVFDFSSGSFRYSSEHEIIFDDNVTGLRMKAIIDKDESLIFVSGYEILGSKTFRLDDGPRYETESLILKDKHTAVVTKRAESIRSNYSSYLSDGVWVHGMASLAIKGDRFRYSMINTTLLEGVWTQNENLIILHDEHTDHDFYLIHEGSRLRTMLLPGDWKINGRVLVPQKLIL